MARLDLKLMLVPLLFILLRVCGIIRYSFSVLPGCHKPRLLYNSTILMSGFCITNNCPVVYNIILICVQVGLSFFPPFLPPSHPHSFPSSLPPTHSPSPFLHSLPAVKCILLVLLVCLYTTFFSQKVISCFSLHIVNGKYVQHLIFVLKSTCPAKSVFLPLSIV